MVHCVIHQPTNSTTPRPLQYTIVSNFNAIGQSLADLFIIIQQFYPVRLLVGHSNAEFSEWGGLNYTKFGACIGQSLALSMHVSVFRDKESASNATKNDTRCQILDCLAPVNLIGESFAPPSCVWGFYPLLRFETTARQSRNLCYISHSLTHCKNWKRDVRNMWSTWSKSEAKFCTFLFLIYL